MKLGSSGLYADGSSPANKRCLVCVYYSQTPQSLKDSITSSFEGGRYTRVAIASSSLSMGIDFHDVK